MEIERQNAGDDRPSPPTTRHMYDESGTLFLNGVQLEPVRSIGFLQSQDQLDWIEQNKLAYMCGSTLVIYNIITGHQSLIPLSEENIRMFRAFKNTYNQDVLVIIHSEESTPPILSTFNSWRNKKDRILLETLEKQEKIVDICYLSESNELVILSTDTVDVSKITRVDLKKEKPKPQSLPMEERILGIFHENRASSPYFYYYTATGVSKCRYQISELVEKRLEITLLEGERILCCSLIEIDSNNTVLYGTSEGNLYICNEVQGKITSVEKEDLGRYQVDDKGQARREKKRPSSICGNDILIFVGYQKSTSMTCFKVSNLSFLKRDQEEIEIDCEGITNIRSMSINSEQATLCLLGQAQTHDTQPQEKKVIPLLFNYLLHETMNIHTKFPFNKIFERTVSHKSVLDMSICLLKKIVLVLTADKKIRAYSLQSPQTLSLFKLFVWEFQFPEMTYSFSVHPVNQSVAVAFKDEIRLYSFGLEGLRYMNLSHAQKSEVIRYSKQGHYLAAIHMNSSIMLFNSHSFEIIYVFNYNNITIKSFEFIANDQYIILNGKNGQVSVITVEGKRAIQNYNRMMKVNACMYDPSYDILIVSYREGVTRILTENGRNQMGIVYTNSFYFTCFFLSSEYGSLFVGTSKGSVRIYQWPVTSFSIFEKSFIQYKLHSSKTSYVALSPDYKYLISSSQDGSTIISRIKHYSNGFCTAEIQINQIFNIEEKNNLIAQFQSLTVNSNNEDRNKDEVVMRLEDDKLIHKESTDGDMGKLRKGYDKKFLSVEAEKRQEKNKISEKYNSEIHLYEELKKQIERKREGIEGKTKEMEILKEEFVQKLRQLYEKKKSLLSLKSSTEAEYSSQMHQSLSLKESVIHSQSQQMVSHLSNKRRNYKKITGRKEAEQKEDQEEAEQHLEEEMIEKSQLLSKYVEKSEMIRKSSEKLEKQNRYLESSISILRERKSKGVILKENIESKLERLVEQQRERDTCIEVATVELKKRDLNISQQEEKSKKLLKFNIYQNNQEGCLKHRLQELEEEYSVVLADFQKLEGEKKKSEGRLVDEAQNRKEFEVAIVEAKNKIEGLKETSAKQLQKLQYKRYCLHKVIHQIERIVSSGEDIKEQLFVVIGTLVVKESNSQGFEQNICEEKENERNVYEILLGGTLKYHEETKNLNTNYQHKIQSHATLLTSEYNRLKFQQINLKKAVKELQMDYKEMKAQKQRVTLNRIRKEKHTETGFFATAVPEKEVRIRTGTQSKNFRKAKICKGNILSKGLTSISMD